LETPLEKKAKIAPKTSKKNLPTPYSATWTARRLKDSPDRAISLLRIWSHPRCHREMTGEAVQQIAALSEEKAIEVLNELKSPRVFV